MEFEKVRDVIVETLGCEADAVTPTASLAEDLGADSLDVVDMLMSLEDEFDVEIPDEEIEKMRTVGEVVSYIEEHM